MRTGIAVANVPLTIAALLLINTLASAQPGRQLSRLRVACLCLWIIGAIVNTAVYEGEGVTPLQYWISA